MDNTGMGSGFLSGLNGGLLDLESSIHRHRQTQLSNSPMAHQCHMNVMTGFENDHHPIELMEMKGLSSKGISMNTSKGKVNSNSTSEEDEPNFTEDDSGESSNEGKEKRESPWQRMKWTDNVIRLLIAVVACVGYDGMLDGMEGLTRKSGFLQKKGKWKLVSKIMISKGCYVSPQQCEDKFNDLNKRYKRLNEILGRGTSCRVVENPDLMDSMPHLLVKTKDDVRKILSSKHLFYKEMCAYHNGQRIPNCHGIDLQRYPLPLDTCSKDNNGSVEEEAEDNDDCETEELDTEDDNNADGDHDRKRVMEEDGRFWSQSVGQDSFDAEMAQIFQDPTNSSSKRREWIKKKMLRLQEQGVSFEAQAFELEKQQFRWLRYCSKKDRELEMLRLENERMRLENERKILQLKQKELEINLKR